jgi:glucose-6-phosphate 1-epimerase
MAHNCCHGSAPAANICIAALGRSPSRGRRNAAACLCAFRSSPAAVRCPSTAWRAPQVDGEVFSGADQDVACARFALQDSAATRAVWPHSFALQLQVELGAGWISLALNVTNTGTEEFDFTAALHTYLATPDVRNAGIEALCGTRFIDSAQGNAESAQSEAILHIRDETDRIYLSPPPVLNLRQDGQAVLQLEQQGFADSVVWNPGPAKAAQLGDMPAADWTRMLCIEAAQIAQPIRLSPQAGWHGRQRLTRVQPA